MDNDYSVPMLQSNPFLKDFFAKHFPSSEVYNRMWRHVYRPSLRMQENLEQIRRQHMVREKKTLFVVGIQIRMQKGTNAYFKGLDLNNFFQMAVAAAHSHGRTGSSVAFFIAADEPQVYSRAALALGADRTFWTDNQIDKKAQGSHGTNPGTEWTGLADLLVLSMCDDIVTTFSSTYGGLAAAMAGIRPIMVFPDADLPHQMQFPRYAKELNL